MRESKFGTMKMETMGAVADEQHPELAKFEDMALAEELCARGYDVKLVALENRKRAWSKGEFFDFEGDDE